MSSPLIRNSVWAAAGEGGRVVTQAVLIILVARSLGTAAFGRFVAATDFLQLTAPFVWCGSVNLLVKKYALGEGSYDEACSTSITTVAVNGSIAVLVLSIAIRPVIFPTVPLGGFVLLALTELTFVGVIETFAYAGLARENLRQAAVIRWAAGISRIVALAIFLLVSRRTESGWYATYLAATGVGAAGAFVLSGIAREGRLHWRYPRRKDLSDGLTFALGGTAFMVQDNIDKPLVLRLGSSVAAGTYEAGYRVIATLLVPFRSVLQATYARFFRSGKKGLRASAQLLRRILPLALVYTLLVGLFAALAAGEISRVFGDGFGETATVIRWLALLPVLRATSSFVGDALTGAGYHTIRARVIVATAVLNTALNLVLIPRMSWRGAAIATLVSETVLAVIVCSVFAHRLMSERGILEEPHLMRVVESATE